jgi:drug/metabolite transporter (DMT)-like permease
VLIKAFQKRASWEVVKFIRMHVVRQGPRAARIRVRGMTTGLAVPMGLASVRERRLGLALGALGVAIFALSIPMTRLASGSAAAPELPAAFVALGRAGVAGLLALGYLALARDRLPRGDEWPWLGATALGVVFGWPLFLGYAVLHVDAVHASVVSGVLPLATATIAAAMLRQRPGAGFWACALAGCALVLAFAFWKGGAAFQAADGLLLLAVVTGAFGYVSGARLSSRMAPQQVISWVLVLSLPITLPLTVALWPQRPASFASWGGFAYVAVFSMWLGFFAWYRGLALGGTVRVSQVQLLQPFLSMLLCVPLLGEPVDAPTAMFSIAVLLTVLASQKVGAGPPSRSRPV